jgi:hypothetical protein
MIPIRYFFTRICGTKMVRFETRIYHESLCQLTLGQPPTIGVAETQICFRVVCPWCYELSQKRPVSSMQCRRSLPHACNLHAMSFKRLHPPHGSGSGIPQHKGTMQQIYARHLVATHPFARRYGPSQHQILTDTCRESWHLRVAAAQRSSRGNSRARRPVCARHPPPSRSAQQTD